jgi:FkbM family methyltransferase
MAKIENIPETSQFLPPHALRWGPEQMRLADLEQALLAAPEDPSRRAAYFDELLRFVSVRTGVTHSRVPEFGHPLALRCGTADIIALLRVVRERIYDFPMRATPQRILVLGAHVGYGALWLARRFPEARILCIEPNAASYRMLALNTLPVLRIQTICAAAWHGPTRLGVRNRMLGDWGMQLHDQMPDSDRVIPARSVSDLLAMAGWDQVDLVVCDVQGAEAAVFADPGQRWLRTLDTLAIFLHENARAQFLDHARVCFDPAFYGQAGSSELTVIERHVPFRAVLRPEPHAMPLIGSEPELYQVGLQDTPQTPWGFFVFDGDSCQIHPNPPGEPPARAIFPRELAGQTRFSATYHHAGRPAAAVVFSLLIVGADGTELLHDSRSLVCGEREEVEIALPLLNGWHHLILQTEMAPDAPQNYNAWAQFLSPHIA